MISLQERYIRSNEWHPKVDTDNTPIRTGEFYYQLPNREVLEHIALLKRGSKILDIVGSKERYIQPVSKMGHNIYVFDVNDNHNNRLKSNIIYFGANIGGNVYPYKNVASIDLPFRDESMDAVLDERIGYTLPPQELDLMFRTMTKKLKNDGLLLFEFATNRERLDPYGNSLIGKNEYKYKKDDGKRKLKLLFKMNGFRDFQFQEKIIHFEKPNYFHTDLIIASGLKNKK